jgi:hypothetical protein
LIGGDAEDIFRRLPAVDIEAGVLADQLGSRADVAEAGELGDLKFLLIFCCGSESRRQVWQRQPEQGQGSGLHRFTA